MHGYPAFIAIRLKIRLFYLHSVYLIFGREETERKKLREKILRWPNRSACGGSKDMISIPFIGQTYCDMCGAR
jgi:hypothetical protein